MTEPKPRGFQAPNCGLRYMCEICGKPRAFGKNTYKHTKCSKIRQARYAEERK